MPEPIGSTILVVDDDAQSVESFRTILESAGYLVHTTADGVEAFQYLQQQVAPAAIVLELHVPRMNGWVFCLEKQRDERFAQVPVLLVSGQTDPAAAAGFLRAAGYLTKPVDPDGLVTALKRVGARPETA
jgi:CheY-like chemotaxis protein